VTKDLASEGGRAELSLALEHIFERSDVADQIVTLLTSPQGIELFALIAHQMAISGSAGVVARAAATNPLLRDLPPELLQLVTAPPAFVGLAAHPEGGNHILDSLDRRSPRTLTNVRDFINRFDGLVAAGFTTLLDYSDAHPEEFAWAGALGQELLGLLRKAGVPRAARYPVQKLSLLGLLLQSPVCDSDEAAVLERRR
jgi:hypothetical protein